ncbi:DUF4279 domain-containing protein [Cognatiluteimonas lumbrici]|uniref:DUF4279 domain-containing protein n=1 Tax=Cognatiluteimonas lumbrici TaxID=2559601 RepID=UPI001126E0FD|nr:DUF4279 domain-containing protein [Luteimonas lumbrici]
MTHQSESTVTLRIFGETLVPSEIEGLLGVTATDSYAKGDVLPGRGKDGGPRLARQGMWRIEVERSEPADLDSQIRAILNLLPSDLAIWSSLDPKFQLDLFCGFFMSEGNEVIALPSETLTALADRSIELVLDIYQLSSD